MIISAQRGPWLLATATSSGTTSLLRFILLEYNLQLLCCSKGW